MVSFLLDGLLVVLLTATIIYAVILDRRLRTFRQAREEMQTLLAHFTAATVQAQSGITSLRSTSETTAAELKGQLDRGKALRDDLSFLLDRGTHLADRLEGGISTARASAKTADNRGKPAVRLAETTPRPVAESRPVERADSRPEERVESRVSPLRAEPRLTAERAEARQAAAETRQAVARAEARAAEPTDAAREFLRALKSAR